jgi:DNA repair protein RadC
MKKRFTVADLPESERPRERFRAHGDKVSIPELLALVLGRGVPGESVLTVAQNLLARFGSLSGIAGASLEDLQTVKGIGPAKAAQIAACFVLARKLMAEENEEKHYGEPVTSPVVAADLVREKVGSYKREHFFVLSFDTRNRFLGIDEVSIGILNANIVHPRETFDAAIRRHAAKIIIAHNHPSDDPEPSEDDLDITRRLAEAGRIVGIELLDHFIVTKSGWLSFREKGLMS